MAKKQKTEGSDLGLGEFDDWFADGESDNFWNEEKVGALLQDEDAVETAARLKREAEEKARIEAEEKARLEAEARVRQQAEE